MNYYFVKTNGYNFVAVVDDNDDFIMYQYSETETLYQAMIADYSDSLGADTVLEINPGVLEVFHDFTEYCEEELNQDFGEKAIKFIPDDIETWQGRTYNDPDGKWEIMGIEIDPYEKYRRVNVIVKNIQEDNLNYGQKCEVPLEEACYFLYDFELHS